VTIAGSLHVLVIEDERDLLDLIDGHLRRMGCRVSRASTGEEGLDRARADPPDMIIVDVLLPGIDGREVTRQLRADPRTRDCRIIISSVLDPQDTDDIASDAVLAKPFRRARITDVVTSIAGRIRQGDT
jgi:CheY-like chemotaxis protein